MSGSGGRDRGEGIRATLTQKVDISESIRDIFILLLYSRLDDA